MKMEKKTNTGISEPDTRGDEVFALRLIKDELKEIETQLKIRKKDEISAKKLQKELRKEEKNAISLELQKKKETEAEKIRAITKESLIDESLEVLDPTPDLQQLFEELDTQCFGGKLKKNGVIVKWTEKMFITAGVTLSKFEDKPIEIRISAKIMKMRTRKDLVETLLHEMIHAFMFATELVDDDKTGHGSVFQLIMDTINAKVNTNVYIYHNWKEEVEYFQNLRKNRKTKQLAKEELDSNTGKQDLTQENNNIKNDILKE